VSRVELRRKRKESLETLRNMARIMEAYPEFARVEVQGHTDTMGGHDYNLRLSRARARTVRRWLRRNGKVRGGRLMACGYGEWQPRVWTKDEVRNQKNRRVQFVIIELDASAASGRKACNYPVQPGVCPDPKADFIPGVQRIAPPPAPAPQERPKAKP